MAFESQASNLVGGDTNTTQDIFVRDRVSRATTRVSVGDAEQEANATSFGARISSNGRFVAFGSHATNLVPETATATLTVVPLQVYLRDLQAGTTARLSVSTTGGQPNADSVVLAVSDYGDVLYFSHASNLVDGDTNGSGDVFYASRDAKTRKVTSGSGSLLPAGGDVTPDGRFVAFATEAKQSRVDTNGHHDVYRRDMQTDALVMVTRGSDGASGAPSISDDGNRIAFSSSATNLAGSDTNDVADVLVADVGAGTITPASVNTAGVQGDRGSAAPSVSGDGAVVAFHSTATNLDRGDTNASSDIFVRNLSAGSTVRLSVADGHVQANAGSHSASVSADGRTVAYESDATNLVAGDTNARSDIFVTTR